MHRVISLLFLNSWMVLSMFGIASSIGGLAFYSHHVLVRFAQVASFFACVVHVFVAPLMGPQRGISS